jgi:hypothetical protein
MADMMREYLIGLGFKIDEASYKKFKDTTTAVAKNTVELGSAVVSTMAAIGASVTAVAREFEDLYYSSQRNKASVADIRATGQGLRQVGIDAQSARSMVEGLGYELRTNPGFKGFLKGFGVSSDDPTEMIVQLVEGLKKRFGDKNYFVAAGVASGIPGFNEADFRKVWDNLDRTKAELAKAKDAQKAAGVAGQNDTFQEFNTSLTELLNNLDNAKVKIAETLVVPAQNVVKALNDVVLKFNEINNQNEGVPGGAFAIGGTAVGGWFGKWLLYKMMGWANPARIMPQIMSRFLGVATGPVGALVASTVPAEGGPDLYKRDKNGNLVPTAEGLQFQAEIEAMRGASKGKGKYKPPASKAEDMDRRRHDPNNPMSFLGYEVDGKYTGFDNSHLLQPRGSGGDTIVNIETNINVDAPGGDAKAIGGAVGDAMVSPNRAIRDQLVKTR